MDGWVKIGVTVDDKEFYKKIKEFEKTDTPEIEVSTDLTVSELQEEIIKAVAEINKIKVKDVVSDSEMSKTKMLVDFIEKANQRIVELDGREVKIKGLNDTAEDLKEIEETARKIDLREMNESINNGGKKVDNVVKKIGKWLVALLGIRTAYSLIQRAVGSVSQYNDQIKTDLDYIGFSLAKMMEPIIQRLIQWVYVLLTYVNYLAKAWFGVNLFANASTDAFKKATKQAKELQKATQGFDEMNVIGGGISGTGTGMPSMDLSAPEDVPIPKWLEWIAENKETILTFFIQLGVVVGALKILSFLSQFEWFGKLLEKVSIGLKSLFTNFTLIKGLGIGLILAGIVILIKGLIDFIKDPSWNNFLTILQGVALVIAGIALLMGGWIIALIALGVAIVTYLIKNWDKVKEILGTVGSWIYDKVIKPVGDFFIGLWNSIKNTYINVGGWFKDRFTDAFNGIKSVFSAVGSFFGGVFSTITNIFKNIGQKIGDVIGSAFRSAINAVLTMADNIINNPIRAINKLVGVINKIPGINLGTLNEVKLPRLKTGGLINMPGPGVPVGGGRAIGGEAGTEGVLPLTDSQAMETLGSAIGRYITLNVPITTTMNGRVISKELKRVNANNDFAMNR